MTTMSRAMKKARVAMPLNQRAWTWLKDHPGKTSKDIAAALKVPQSNVSSVLTDMVARKMVDVKKEPGLGGVPTGHYSTSPKLKAYALLPKPKKPGKGAEPPAAPAPAAVPTLDTMSVKQAYELYKQLHAMFGGKGA